MRNKKLDILIVEDNPGDSALIEEYLRESIPKGIIKHANSLAAALLQISNQHFDIVLLDLSLPDSIGMDSFKTIRQEAANSPIVILTGFEDMNTALDSINEGAQDYIVKDEATPALLARSIKYAIERNRFREDLKKSEEQYKKLFYDNPVPMMAYDGQSGYIYKVNEAAVRLYGYTTAELLNMRFNELEVTGDADEVEQRKLGSATAALHKTGHGDAITVEIASHQINLDGKEFVLAVLQDVSEKNTLINELTRSNTDLQQFSYITSHNLRSPLANMLSIIGLIDQDAVRDPVSRQLLQNLQECTLQLNDTVNDLINVLLIRNNVQASVEPLAISKIWEKVTSSMQTAITEQGAIIRNNFEAGDCISFNRSYLESILLNLLTNALKYSSPERVPVIEISTSVTPKGLRLLFTDNGLGIDLKKHGNRIFGLYQRFHEHADSKGMGLYMVNAQLRALGGHIEVKSEVNAGTTFIIHFKKRD